MAVKPCSASAVALAGPAAALTLQPTGGRGPRCATYPDRAAGIAISMDGRGRFMDNIFIERLWRSIKYEEVHLKAYADGREAGAGIGFWMTFYNFRRPHQAMNNHMPMAVWRAGMDRIEAAVEASIWTDRMVWALGNGVKGGKWATLNPAQGRGRTFEDHRRWPNVFFADRGLLTLKAAHESARDSR
jgi:hypothetical protein